VIGVYEPMVLVVDGEVHQTSRAAIKDDPVGEGARRYHRECYADGFGPSEENGSRT
jgi:hypothetical protein